MPNYESTGRLLAIPSSYDGDKMKETIDVQTGQVKAAGGKTILRAIALGSCVAVIIYDAKKKNAAMAHVMLPGRAPSKASSKDKTRYAADAIDALLEKMAVLGSEKHDFQVAVVGGANVLKRENDTIARDNVASNLRILREMRLEVVAKSVGGTVRRNVSIDIENGIITYAQGDNCDNELWRC